MLILIITFRLYTCLEGVLSANMAWFIIGCQANVTSIYFSNAFVRMNGNVYYMLLILLRCIIYTECLSN